MRNILEKANDRGRSDFGWLKSHHSFSFGEYHNTNRMGFGKLLVINDDWVEPSRGFDTHPHRDMEIISIPLSGSLYHKDSMGNEHIVKEGEVQRMTAGTGIRHSEYNASDTEMVNFLQIWVLPKKKDLTPSYDQKQFEKTQRENQFQLILSPNGLDGSLSIHQDAWLSLAKIGSNKKIVYDLHDNNNCLYVFNISGSVLINDIETKERDGVGLESVEKITIKGITNGEILVIEIPQ